MKRIALLFLACCAALAQEDPRARAKELEIQAGKALDEGRRADALKLLAEAADLRAKVRDVAVPEPGAKPAPPAPQGPMADASAKPQAPAASPSGKAAAVSLGAMDAALKNGDAASALKAGEEARKALAGWAEELSARERRLADAGPVEDRVARLEQQVEELRRLATR